MKLYWGPHTCAIGVHILLEEIGRPYETERIDVSGGATHEPWFQAINPKGKVPTLVLDDGSVLTEFGAIATWLGRLDAGRHLIPADAMMEARMVETLDYVEGTIHGQGYARIFVPRMFAPQDMLHAMLALGQEAVQKQGRDMVEMGFGILDPQLGRHPYVAGEQLTIGDAALFYVERWAPQQEISMPVNIKAHYERMLARPAVHKVMELWDEA